MLVVASVLAGLLSTSSCWDVYDTAMRHAAQAAEPRFVSYDEDIWVKGYGQMLVDERTHVDYRDDGVAVVLDDNGGKPVVTTQLEPGPPVLGPYGDSKARWEPQNVSPLRTIADVRVDGNDRCENAGIVQIDGVQAFHLIFHRTDTSRPGLEQMWIDAQSADIRRLIVAGAVTYTYSGSTSTQLVDFNVQVTKVGGFSVISHVTWWQGFYVGDYTFRNFKLVLR